MRRLVVAGLLGCAAAPAQDAGHAAPQPLLVPIHTAEADGGVPYGTWAAGPTYKASFHDGATFVPLLGADYPRNMPLSWRTRSVRVGATELATERPQLTCTEMRAEYDLGEVVEAYDVRRDGLEQTFVLRARPSGEGDLEIHGSFTTQLHAAAVHDAHQPLLFLDDAGRHVATYGAATAVDARGRRRPMTTGFRDGEVVLRLDREWLSTATFPVVVDPLLGPGDIASAAGAAITEVDITHRASSIGQPVWIAYVSAASALDRDVYLQRWSHSGILGSQAFYDVTASWSTSGVQCAIADVVDHAVVVFDRYFPTPQTRGVRFHKHDVGDLTANTTFVAIAASDNAWRPDVGGIFLNPVTSEQALVVWQQEPNGGGPFAETNSSDIYGCFVDLVAGSAGTPFPIATASLQDQERPSVNQRSGGSIDPFLVAYQTYNALSLLDDWDVAVRSVSVSGNVSAAKSIDDASPDHKMAPEISGHTGRYVVAFTTSTLAQQPGKPTGANGHQIRVARLNWSGTNGTEPWGTVVLQSNNDPRLELGGLGFDSDSESHWALMFRSTASDYVYMRTVGHRGQQLQAETVYAPSGSTTSVAGGVGFSENYRQFSLAYASNGQLTSFVRFDRFDYPAVQPWSATGPGCSSASIQWEGRQEIGSYFTRIRVLGAPPNSIHLLVLATAPAQGLLSGIPLFTNGCWLLVPNLGPDHLGILIDVGSNASWSLPLPEFLSSGTFYFQDFHTDGSGNFVLVSTQRLEVPVVK